MKAESPHERCIDCHHLIFSTIVDGSSTGEMSGPFSESRRTSLITHHAIQEIGWTGIEHIAFDFQCRDNRWGPRGRLYVDFRVASSKASRAPSTFAMTDDSQAALFDAMLVETDRSDWGCFVRAQPGRDLEKVVEEAKLTRERKYTEAALQAASASNRIQFRLLIVTIIALVVNTIVQVIDLICK